MQQIFTVRHSTCKVVELLEQLSCRKYMLVCGSSFDRLPIGDLTQATPLPCVRFSAFTANPQYDQVEQGVALFRQEQCDAIVAVGGGSAMDVAKCIKLFCRMDPTRHYLEQPLADTGIPLIAVPTTAGSGSESTRFAVLYRDGVKQSVAHPSITPDFAVLDATLLRSLPLYQKKCTLLDALCQAIESWWSVNSTEESRTLAQRSVALILEHYRDYLWGEDPTAAEGIMQGANLAGRAIHITQTTAAHAMSYKMTTLYGIPHGHAVALSLPLLLAHMLHPAHRCIDPRGDAYLQDTLRAIAAGMGQSTPHEAVTRFTALLQELEMAAPSITDADLELLTASVDPTRLKNHPVSLDAAILRELYRTIAQGGAAI